MEKDPCVRINQKQNKQHNVGVGPSHTHPPQRERFPFVSHVVQTAPGTRLGWSLVCTPGSSGRRPTRPVATTWNLQQALSAQDEDQEPHLEVQGSPPAPEGSCQVGVLGSVLYVISFSPHTIPGACCCHPHVAHEEIKPQTVKCLSQGGRSKDLNPGALTQGTQTSRCPS